MTSCPSTIDDPGVSPSLYAFFQAELANQETMESEARMKDREPPEPATLGTAYDSLVQAPDDVIARWFTPAREKVRGLAGLPVAALVEFGRLIEKYGVDTELDDFAEDRDTTWQ